MSQTIDISEQQRIRRIIDCRQAGEDKASVAEMVVLQAALEVALVAEVEVLVVVLVEVVLLETRDKNHLILPTILVGTSPLMI